jgi:hypothetical protein
MKLWFPNQRQGWVILGVYLVALLVCVEWTSSSYETRPRTTQDLIDEAQRKLQLHKRLEVVRNSLQKVENTQPYTLKEADQKIRLDFERSKLEREISEPTPKEFLVATERFDPSLTTNQFLALLVVGGILLIWRFQTVK